MINLIKSKIMQLKTNTNIIRKRDLKITDRVSNICNECGLEAIRTDSANGTRVCIECGLVADSRIINFNQSEERNFDGNAAASRLG